MTTTEEGVKKQVREQIRVGRHKQNKKESGDDIIFFKIGKEDGMKTLKEFIESKKTELNYSELPDKVKSAIEPINYVLEIETKLTWDGHQFVVRIPKEIVDGYHITKSNRMMFKFVKFSPMGDKGQEKPRLEISVI